MAFLLKIGAIRMLAEKAVPERNGVRIGSGGISHTFVNTCAQKNGLTAVGIGTCAGRIHR
jgi:hypothetical protein